MRKQTRQAQQLKDMREGTFVSRALEKIDREIHRNAQGTVNVQCHTWKIITTY